MIPRLASCLGLGALLLAAPAALAQPKPPPPGAAAPQPEPPPGVEDPVSFSVDGRQVHLSEVGKVVQTLPPSLRSLPFDRLYPDLQERLIDQLALAMMARRAGLDSKPDVRQDILAATDRVLEGAYLAQTAVPLVTDEAIRLRYDQLYGHRAAIDEVHARHILVPTEAEARSVIEQLRKGADFATLARAVSKDADAVEGGDIGFVRRADVWPDFADVAFALTPGQVAPDPLRNEFGWHVIKVEARRTTPVPTFDAVAEQIRRELLAEAVRTVIRQAREQVIIRRYNVNGTATSATAAADAAAAAVLPR